MKRNLWGALNEDEDDSLFEKLVSQSVKEEQLEEAMKYTPKSRERRIAVKVENPHVTQTIEVMKQTEMLKSLIDTYSNKSGSSNYLVNPCQVIPQVDFPPENSTVLQTNERFTKPLWFLPPEDTDFTRGIPKSFPQINKDVCIACLRKAISGQLCITGFTDTTESALVLFIDAVQEFIRGLMTHVKDIQTNEYRERQNSINIVTLEKAYYSLTNTSLMAIHNYFNHNLIARNRQEIQEFKGVLNEYDKLMKESQKTDERPYQGTDLMEFLEFSTPGGVNHHDSSKASTSSHLMGYIEGQEHLTVHDGSVYHVHGRPMDIEGITEDQIQFVKEAAAAAAAQQ